MKSKVQSKSKRILYLVDQDKHYGRHLFEKYGDYKQSLVFYQYTKAKDYLKSLKEGISPDISIINIQLEDMSGLECCKRVKNDYPTLSVLLISDHPNIKALVEAKKLHLDYLDKGPKIDAFFKNLIKSLQKDAFIDSHILLSSTGDIPSAEVKYLSDLKEMRSRLNHLSKNQIKILRLKQDGKSNQEIANIMQISPNTVHTHWVRATKKLRIPNPMDYLFE